jgi:hypothetical protein
MESAPLIRSGNANVNAPILEINRELGFRPLSAETLWQVDLATAQPYVGTRDRSGEPERLASDG